MMFLVFPPIHFSLLEMSSLKLMTHWPVSGACFLPAPVSGAENRRQSSGARNHDTLCQQTIPTACQLLFSSNFYHDNFCARKQVLLSVRLSHRNPVRLSITRVDQSKMMQDRITKYSASAARKTLVSGTVKLCHKFKGGHSERRR